MDYDKLWIEHQQIKKLTAQLNADIAELQAKVKEAIPRAEIDEIMRLIDGLMEFKHRVEKMMSTPVKEPKPGVKDEREAVI